MPQNSLAPATYRRFDGSLEDAAGLLAVESASWDESPHSPASLQQLLNDSRQEQICWLADVDGEVAGFAHAFLTLRDDAATWELDLLAVHPRWRRKGIATELVRRATADAPSRAARSRAFIAVANRPSARAFERAGYTTDGAPHSVYVLDVPPENAPQPDVSPGVTVMERGGGREWVASVGKSSLSFKTVRTFLYAGLWIEGFGGYASPDFLDAALAHAHRLGLDVVGLVVPDADSMACKHLEAAAFESLGHYHVWLYAYATPENPQTKS